MPALLFTYLLGVALAGVHDFHISRLTVNLDAAQARTEVTLHTFVDDVELAVARHHDLGRRAATDARLPTQATLDFLAPTEHPLADSLVEAYLRRKIRFSVDGEALAPFRYLGSEAADDPYAVYFYFASDMPEAGTTLAVASDFFTELYEDQQNVVVWQRASESDGYDLLTDRHTVSTYRLKAAPAK